MAAPLNGIRIIEFGHYIAAPFCGQILADLGAEVIKLERPGGEAAHDFGPFCNGESLYYTSYNRNKLGMTLNLKKEAGKQVFRELAATADIIIENQRPGLLDSMGFSYENLSRENPGIILTRISGFGQDGLYKDRPALDMIMQAYSGIMSITGRAEDPPTKAGFAIVDFTAAFYAAIGTLAALEARKSTGRGQVVDIAMSDGIFSLLENFPSAYLLTGFVPPRVGNTRVITGPSNNYATKDGYVYIAAVADKHFKILMEIIGHSELSDLPEFGTSAKRKANQAPLDEVIGAWSMQHTTEEAFRILSNRGIPAAPINDIPHIVSDPQMKSRDMIVHVHHEKIDDLPLIGTPLKLSDTPAEIRTAPPVIGQHNQRILTEILGYSAEKVSSLKNADIF